MSNVDRERPWQVSHDEVPNPAKRRTLMFLGALGAAGFAAILYKNLPPKGPDTNSYDQNQALKFIEQARGEGSLIEAKIINPDDPGDPVKSRRSPARLASNFLREVEDGEKIHGVVVTEVTGYQDAADELPGTWFAFGLPNNRSGFINTKFIERYDGQPLIQEGTKIYDTRTGGSIVIGQSQASK